MTDECDELLDTYTSYGHVDEDLKSGRTKYLEAIDNCNEWINKVVADQTTTHNPPTIAVELAAPVMNYVLTTPFRMGNEKGGHPWDNTEKFLYDRTWVDNGYRLVSVQFRGGTNVDRLFFTCRSESNTEISLSPGRDKGTLSSTMYLLDGEFINYCKWRSEGDGGHLNYVEFRTNFGAVVRSYIPEPDNGSVKEFTLDTGQIIVGFTGRNGSYIDQITPVVLHLKKTAWRPV